MADSLIALVGGETLLGADVRELLAERVANARVRLVGAQAIGTAILTEGAAGEADVITGIDSDTLTEAKLVILAGSPDSSRKALAMLRNNPEIPVLDLTFGAEDLPEARLAPEPARIQVVPHPAASVLVALLRTLHAGHTVERTVAHLMAPASEFGRAGVTELQHQTAQLLSFQPLEKQVFGGEQLGFNLLAGAVAETEARIEKHVASLLGRTPEVPMPSLRVTLAPVMHGYSMSIWVSLAGSRDGVEATLKEGGFDIWPDNAPNVVGVAGQSGISLGAMAADHNDHRGYWIWAAADQFRVQAGQAVALAGHLLR